MRGFMILAVLAVARADVGGYNYGAGIGGSSTGGSLSGGSISGGSISGGSISGGSISGGSISGGSISGGSLSGGSLTSGSYSNDYAPVNTEFNKEFFTYTAPEADFEDNKSVSDLAASLKKNLRVVFIRAPENKGLENAALALAKQAAEQQTAIYVLTKQGDLSSLANQLQNLNHVSASKPEVHFVKYRTQEDALNAQRTIQQEYERLGGSSTSHNGGVAPVLDFATKQQVQHHHQQQQQQQQVQLIDERRASISSSSAGVVSAELEAPSAGYIPPAAAAPSSTYLPVNKVK